MLRALKRYGMILADNGAPWFVGGAPSRGWDNDDLHSLGACTGSDFEVVDTSSLPRPAFALRASCAIQHDCRARSRRPAGTLDSPGDFATRGEDAGNARSEKEVWPWHRVTA